MSTTTSPRLSDEQQVEFLELVKHSDSVELKLTVPEHHHASTVSGLGMDPLQAQIRQVFFFDTPDLTLDKAGLVVRARRIQGKGDDSVVKLRPVVPHELPPELRDSPSFRVEVDALPGGFVCSGALKRPLSATAVRSTLAGERPLRKLFSKEQRALYAAHAPEGLGLDDLTLLGPDLRAQAAAGPEGARAPDRRRDVALPGRLPHPRAVDPLRDERGVPGGGRGSRLPHPARRRPLGRAADEDPQGARVLREARAARCVTRRYAAIDVGTNSVKLHVGERLDDGGWRTVVDRSEMTRLGEGVAETGRLGEEPIRRTVAAIAELADDARRNGAEGIAAVGTAGLRQAANAADFLAAAREQAGVEVEVISGEEEARLSVLAATDALHLGRGTLAVFETGGGSSQFTFGELGRIDEQFSLDLGAVPVTERFGLDRAVDRRR